MKNETSTLLVHDIVPTYSEATTMNPVNEVSVSGSPDFVIDCWQPYWWWTGARARYTH
jgi:hypothetical protein